MATRDTRMMNITEDEKPSIFNRYPLWGLAWSPSDYLFFRFPVLIKIKWMRK